MVLKVNDSLWFPIVLKTVFFSRVEVVGKIMLNGATMCHLDVLLKSVCFSASDSENEGDREGGHSAARHLSQQVINVFHETSMQFGRLAHQWCSFKLK